MTDGLRSFRPHRERKVMHVELEYPRCEGNYNAIDISLCCIRASDGILVAYDFDRDGWVISQPTVLGWHPDDKECDPCYKEVAFVQSWQLMEELDGEVRAEPFVVRPTEDESLEDCLASEEVVEAIRAGRVVVVRPTLPENCVSEAVKQMTELLQELQESGGTRGDKADGVGGEPK